MNFNFPSRLRELLSERGDTGNRPSSVQNGLARRLVTSTTVLVSLSVLSLGLTAGSAAASGAGVVTAYTGTGIHDPHGITAGPDGALWFTNRGTTRSGGSPRPGWSPTTPAPSIRPVRDHGRVPTAPCGSPTTATTRSGGSRTAGVVTNYTAPASTPYGITAGPDGALWFTNSATTRSGGSPRPGWSPTTPVPASHEPDGITAGPDGALWFTNVGNDSIGRITHDRGGHQLHRHRHPRPGRDHGRPRRRPVVHQRRQQLDRADHHGRGGHQLHRHRHRRARRDHGRSRRRPVVHQLDGPTRSGGSRTAGVVTNYTGTGIDDRSGSRPGPTGRCGSPTPATTRSGGSAPLPLRASRSSPLPRARWEPR